MLRLLGSFLRHPQWRHLVGLGLLDRDLRLESVHGLGLETSVMKSASIDADLSAGAGRAEPGRAYSQAQRTHRVAKNNK